MTLLLIYLNLLQTLCNFLLTLPIKELSVFNCTSVLINKERQGKKGSQILPNSMGWVLPSPDLQIHLFPTFRSTLKIINIAAKESEPPVTQKLIDWGGSS